MVTDAAGERMLPHDLPFMDEEDARHLEDIGAARAPDPVALEDGPDPVEPGPGPHELPGRRPLQPKSDVELPLWIQDRRSFRPQLRHQRIGHLLGALVHEDDPRKLRVRGGQFPKIGHRLTAEWSAEVTQEDQHHRGRTQLVPEGAGHQVTSGDLLIEWEFGHGLPIMIGPAPICCIAAPKSRCIICDMRGARRT